MSREGKNKGGASAIHLARIEPPLCCSIGLDMHWCSSLISFPSVWSSYLIALLNRLGVRMALPLLPASVLLWMSAQFLHKAETPVLCPPHAKSWLIGKDSDAGRDWGQEEKGMTEDEMARWHHRLDGCEFE